VPDACDHMNVLEIASALDRQFTRAWRELQAL
jgi:hypothetical protein